MLAEIENQGSVNSVLWKTSACYPLMLTQMYPAYTDILSYKNSSVVEHKGLLVFLLMESVRGQESPCMGIILFGEEKELNHVCEHVPWASS